MCVRVCVCVCVCVCVWVGMWVGRVRGVWLDGLAEVCVGGWAGKGVGGGLVAGWLLLPSLDCSSREVCKVVTWLAHRSLLRNGRQQQQVP